MTTGPLAGSTGGMADWPAAAAAGRLLSDLGAEMVKGMGTTLTLNGRRVSVEPTDEIDDWATTTVAPLTGRPNGPALVPAGHPATFAKALSLAIRALGGAVDDGPALLGMRTGIADLRRGGDVSANGLARLLPASDDWFALNVARPSDPELVAALMRREPNGDLWQEIAAWARKLPARDIIERAATLGLAVARLGESRHDEPWVLTRWGGAGPPLERQPRVVNLGALWAGPLAAHILYESGAEVIDVDTGRAATTPSAWRERLTAGHERVMLDLGREGDRAKLRRLLTQADVVIEASRPRALRQLGVDADRLMTDGQRRVWLRITGHPRPAERIAYGDDAAVAGGLVAWDGVGPVFAGDAMADPLSGLAAAMLALACLQDGGAWTADVMMAGVAARAATPVRLS